ncbi:TadE family type IV pilus minor pilin [Streptomyces sp. NPDC058664]|uniref:TadE family type IV pilus minor pilin n=1 Tax=unclassified Streptomyces TaxID=2593676 RepID=UPI00365FCCC8
MVLPVLALFTVVLLWALAAAAAQIRCVDAARAGARAAARAEPVSYAEAAARSAAPEGARVSVTRSGELWRVTVEAAAPGPRGMGLTLRADAAALAEDTPAGGAAGVPEVGGSEFGDPEAGDPGFGGPEAGGSEAGGTEFGGPS